MKKNVKYDKGFEVLFSLVTKAVCSFEGRKNENNVNIVIKEDSILILSIENTPANWQIESLYVTENGYFPIQGNYWICHNMKDLLNEARKKIKERKQEDIKKKNKRYEEVKPEVKDQYTVGAILEDQWGWEQTNVDFYCIVKRQEQWITVLPMTKNTESEGNMTSKCKAENIDFSTKPIRRRVHSHNGKETGFSIRNYSGGGWCSLWDGVKSTETHYA